MKKPAVAKTKPVFLLAGLGLLLFAGYAITLRGRTLAAGPALSLLGEKNLRAGAPAAFRVLAWDPRRGQALMVSQLELSLTRPSGQQQLLASLAPGRPVVDVNGQMPRWPPGPARLELKARTSLGDSRLHAEVTLDASGQTRLRLTSPRKTLTQAPVLIRQSPTGFSAEIKGMAAVGAPQRVVFFPGGRKFSSSFANRMLVRILAADGRPAVGKLRLGQGPYRPSDAAGFVEQSCDETQSRLQFSFHGLLGSLEGQAKLARTPTQIEVAPQHLWVKAGQQLNVDLRSLSAAAILYLDAWSQEGWRISDQVQMKKGRASMALTVPDQSTGPLVLRFRDNPFGQGLAMSEVVLWVGPSGKAANSAALAWLRRLPADQNFWAEMGALTDTDGRNAFRALLSRVAAPDGELPVLVDGQVQGQQAVQQRRRDVIQMGLWWVGLLSVLIWLAVAWNLLRASHRAAGNQRARSFRIALLALAVAVIALAGGWVCLWWIAQQSLS